VIVREGESPLRLWLTGFDAPCLHTMYADRPVQGRGKCRIRNVEVAELRNSHFCIRTSSRAYHNRAISTVEVIEELIKLAKEMDAANKRGEDLGLTDDAVCF